MMCYDHLQRLKKQTKKKSDFKLELGAWKSNCLHFEIMTDRPEGRPTDQPTERT